MTETPFLKAVLAPCGLAAVALCAVLPTAAQAHGAKIEYKIAPAIALQAMYDAGEPMTTAQVTVYAPSDPSKPWLTGKTDKEGRFSFVPDPAIAGEWVVQAREAGHGAMIHVTLGNDSAAAQDGASGAAASGAASGTPVAAAPVQSEAQSPLQRWLMGASAVWGLIGTALFFARKKAG